MKIILDAQELIDAMNLLSTSMRTLASVMQEEHPGSEAAVLKPEKDEAAPKAETPEPAPKTEEEAPQPLTDAEAAEVKTKAAAFFKAGGSKAIVKSWLDEHGYERVTQVNRKDLPGFMQLIAG